MFMAQFYSWKRYVFFLFAAMFAGVVSTQAQVNLTITTVNGSFPSEVGWQIVNQSTNVVYSCEPTGGTIQNNVTISVPAGNYEIRAWDSFGDTWNNAKITLKYTATGVTLVNAATMTLRLRSSNSCVPDQQHSRMLHNALQHSLLYHLALFPRLLPSPAVKPSAWVNP